MEAKKWEDLQIKDDFMFGVIMLNPEICRLVLERILEISIERVEYPEEQKSIRLVKDAKSVRLDVYVKDGKNSVYNIEIQTSNPGNLEKRSRYYQGMIDLNLIRQGQPYSKLNRSYIIFLCTFDPFGEGFWRYTFENRCREKPDLLLNDETTRIFMNTRGTRDDVSGHVKRFLRFIDSGADPDPDDSLLYMMNRELEKVRADEEWRREYMTLFLRDQENIEKGRQEGLQKGRQEMLEKMLRSGMSAEQISTITETPLEEIKKLEHTILTMA